METSGIVQTELALAAALSGVPEDRFTLADDGFFSRGYVAEGGRVVFKFPKASGVDYRQEIRMLDYLNTLPLGLSIQRVGWRDEQNRYLGLYGVEGRPLERLSLTPALRESLGEQLGRFLRALHRAEPDFARPLGQEDELAAWTRRYRAGRSILAGRFSARECARMDEFFLKEGPERLDRLGQRLVFSHGDLGDGNILMDQAGRAGVIDFSEALLLEEAADFMDLGDEGLCRAALQSCGAQADLREKVALRRAMRPFFVLETYAPRGEAALEPHLQKIAQWLERGLPAL